MDGEVLAVELAPWLDARRVSTVGRRHLDDPDACEERDMLILAHPQLDSGLEGNIAELVLLYLDNFEIPARWLSTLRSMLGPALADEAIWDWLAGLRFEGEVEIDSDVTRLSVPVDKAHILIYDRWAVTEILMRPLQALFGSAVTCLDSWREALSVTGPENLFLLSRGDGALAAFIDGWVAEGSGIQHPGLGGRRRHAVSAGYRRSTAMGSFEELRSGRELAAAREGLATIAEELRR